MFGSSQSSNIFGKPAGSSLFGNSAANTGSTFGSTTGSGLFSKPAGSGLFGSTTQNKPAFGGSSTFGTQAQSTGSSLFGSNQQSGTAFGTSTGGSGLFGGSQQNTGGSLFGKTTSTSMFGSTSTAQSGTTVKFNPVIGSDSMMKNGSSQQISTKNYCISAMKEYEGKSFEELRAEDYAANRKAPAAGSTGIFANTSTTTTGGGLFGGGTQQKSLFGSTTTTSSPFGGGAGGSSLFGGNNNTPQQQQSGGGLFGSKPATGSLFGGGTSTTTGSAFGNTSGTGGGLFGKTTSSPFGSAQQTTGTSLFGQPAQQQQQSGGLFGSNTANTNTAFGTATTGGGLFGNTQANTSGGLFGKPATSTGFGAFSTTSQPATSGGLFGNTTAAKPGLFGNTTTTTTGGGLFGNTTAQQSGGGLFGGQTQQTGGLFGANTQQQQQGNVVVSNPATVAVATQPIVLGSDVNETMLKMAMIEANLATNPYGDSPLLKLAAPVDTDDKPNPISTQRQMRFLKKAAETGVTSPTSANSPIISKSSFLSMNVPVAGAKVRSRAIAVNGDLNYKSTRTPPTLGKGIGGKITSSNNTTLNSSFNGSFCNKSIDPHIERALSNNSNTLPGSTKKGSIKHLDLDEIKSAMKTNKSILARSPRDADELPVAEQNTEDAENVMNTSVHADPRDAAYRRAEIQRQPPVQIDLNLTSETNTSVVSSPSLTSTVQSEDFSPAGVTLKTNDYYSEPTVRAMCNMIVDGEVVLPEGLTVGRATFGNVYWPGPLKLKNIALDEVVIFRHKEVTVYPDESIKPPLGEGLNRPAEVTLERVWYINRETKEEVRDPIVLANIGWRDRLERVTRKMGAIFKDYRPSTGSWVFKVEHFSKYGLPDEDEEEKPTVDQMKERQLQSRVQRTVLHTETFTDVDEVPEELEMEEILFVSQTRTVPTGQSRRGLGGGLDLLSDMETGYEDEQDDEFPLPPEKKPKIDIDDREESKFLLEQLKKKEAQFFRHKPAEPQLQCVTATTQFEGGYPLKKCKGFGMSQFMDLQSARGTVARIGWSAKGLFVNSLQPENNGILIRSLRRSGTLQEDYVTDMLEHNIRCSQIIQRNHSISAKVRHHEMEGQQVAPRVKPSNDHAQLIDSFCATAAQSNRTDEERVWKLCRALFPGNNEGRWRWDRLENVCSWLREEVALLPKANITGRGSSVWEALCRGNLEDAITAADEEDLLYLSTLLATFQVDPRATQQDFQAQIEFWDQFRMIEHVDLHILKIYLMLAGQLSVSYTSKGKKKIISCIEGLPWKQAMGIYLWYLRGYRCFEETLDEAVEQIPSVKDADDILFYHLMRLSRDSAYSVEKLLDSAIDFSSSFFDGHLSWHLWTVLRSIGYNTMEPAAEQRLHTTYAEQLMANDLPQDALYVLSHISNDQSRSAVMRECLDRFAMSLTIADYDKICQIVNLPKSWIAAARYIKAKANGQLALACEMALEAGNYIEAFLLFVREVAPNAVVSDDMAELERLVNLFEPVAARIPGWGYQGQLYADYVDFKNLPISDEDEDDAHVSELISSMTTKLQAPVFDTPIQRLCAQNIGLEMFEAQRLLTGRLSFQMPFDLANLSQELTRSVVVATTDVR